MPNGTVKWFNATKGYGFIQPEDGGKDVFVHISAVERAGLNGLNEGQTVSYELTDERGKTAAVNLKARIGLKIALQSKPPSFRCARKRRLGVHVRSPATPASPRPGRAWRSAGHRGAKQDGGWWR